jgi:hypothetical protein
MTFLSWVLGCALFATVVAVVVYVRTKSRSPAIETFENSPLAQRELKESLSNANAGPGTLESLRMLEDRDRGTKGTSP